MRIAIFIAALFLFSCAIPSKPIVNTIETEYISFVTLTEGDMHYIFRWTNPDQSDKAEIRETYMHLLHISNSSLYPTWKAEFIRTASASETTIIDGKNITVYYLDR